MKTFKFIIAFLFTTLSCSLFAQSKSTTKTDTVKVYGNCEMCQAKIEKAAKKGGAAVAKWDVDSKILAVSYSSAKSSLDKIEKSIAAAGYDTEHETSTAAAYKGLPSCCQYDRKDDTKKE